ncbi:MAG: hypothetical protein ACRC14_19135 [Paracoccaceae bacterium]
MPALLIVLFLQACVQTMISSTVVLEDEYVTAETIKVLVATTYAKASELGGECRLISIERSRHTCNLHTGNPSFQLGVGFNSKGVYVISVESTLVHWLPPSRKRVVSGYYLDNLHKELENWMIELVPRESIVRATRRYNDYDYPEDILGKD